MKVLVIGLGYVGLPTASLAAKAGHLVLGIDVAREKVLALARKLSIRVEVELNHEAILGSAKEAPDDRFFFRFSDASAAGPTVLILTVDTPLAGKIPDLTNLLQATSSAGECVRVGDLVLIESTVAPGTTRGEVLRHLENSSGLRAGDDFSLAYSPERIDPGNSVWSLPTIPKLVAGIDLPSLTSAKKFYESLRIPVVEVPTIEEAEMAKLVENSFRAVNIAFANEVQVACAALGINWQNVLDAADSKPFGFMRFNPGSGVGGHCIPVDPAYLTNAVAQATTDSKMALLEVAMERNNARPLEVAHSILAELGIIGKPAAECRVVLIGLGYKRGSGDVRNSPAHRIARILEKEGVAVHGFDSVVDSADWPWPMSSVQNLAKTNFDLGVLLSAAGERDFLEVRKSGVRLFNPLELRGDGDAC